MYTYIESVCLSRSIGSQWKKINIENVTLVDLFQKFSQIYLTLSTVNGRIYVDFNTLRREFSNSLLTFKDWLPTVYTRTLETVATIPSTEITFAKYSDIFQSGYKLNVHGAKNVLITRPNTNTDLSLIDTHCLVTVNGYVHNTTYTDNQLKVINAAVSMGISDENHMGIISFANIGRLTKVIIDDTRITIENNPSVLKNRITFSISESMANKSFFLVIGGYIIFPSPNVLWYNNDNTFTLDLNNTPFIERIYESSLYLDLSSLQLKINPINKDMINVNELYSDEVLKKYMTMSQSFLVIVNIPNLKTNKINIRSCNMPGVFTAYQDPVYPLIVNYGKVAEYWKTYDEGHWSLSVSDSFMRNYILSETPIAQLPNVTNNLKPEVPTRHSNGYFLEISGYK